MSESNQQDFFGDQIEATTKQVLAAIDGLESADMKKIYAQRLVEIYELHAHVIQQVAGITGAENHKLSAALVASIGNYFGGVSFYLPHNDKLDRFIRDVQIYKAFDGDNVTELAKKFRVSQQTIYTAIAKQRDLRQKKLF
ncbi:MAG: hypothetical protein COW76_20430 [Shewanella sp. CG18_big_fil_WC_8_21_14_2_50_42_11]|uniref:Mor transcription activator family protein n=1 Tax=Shewanella sp. CG18_big_fil_WC_8_21_14_2_50_42_11 TaxID=1975538 RepID=UPI000C445A83|nr:Mor transcription activator family protein [Shewanella sp. CG18_big_fil_WC_8_21_14_2_50_42_11]PIP98531.1 MAG: hypothetical protein COW76_20430 [Shewanella sp. CG18_big_fil_WC_8_21_14_2_50_42_11]